MTSLFDPNFLKAMLLWVSMISGYPIPEGTVPPPIEFTSEAIDSGCDGEWDAFTDFTDGHIFLNKKNWPNRTKIDKNCIIAHELTHFLQYKNHVNNGQLEPPAYKVSEVCYRHYGDLEQAKWARSEIKRHEISCRR